jgi:hypothetical protein
MRSDITIMLRSPEGPGPLTPDMAPRSAFNPARKIPETEKGNDIDNNHRYAFLRRETDMAARHENMLAAAGAPGSREGVSDRLGLGVSGLYLAL